MRPVRQEEAPIALGVAVRGAALGLLLTLVLLCALALVLLGIDLDDRPLRWILGGIGALGTVAAGFLAGLRGETHGFAHGALAGFLFVLLVLLLGWLFFGAGFSLLSWSGRLLAGIVLGAVGGVIGVNFS